MGEECDVVYMHSHKLYIISAMEMPCEWYNCLKTMKTHISADTVCICNYKDLYINWSLLFFTRCKCYRLEIWDNVFPFFLKISNIQTRTSPGIKLFLKCEKGKKNVYTNIIQLAIQRSDMYIQKRGGSFRCAFHVATVCVPLWRCVCVCVCVWAGEGAPLGPEAPGLLLSRGDGN